MSEINKQLKKKGKKINHLFKNSRDNIFGKNSIILRKDEASRNVYYLKQGQASIINEQGQVLYTYPEGIYLNCIESSMQISTLKTIKAIRKCHITFQIWGQAQSDKYKKQVLIPKRQEMKFYHIPMFINVPYQLSLQLAQFFTLEKHKKHQLIQLAKDQTYFIVEGTLLIQNSNTKMSLLKLEKGQMLVFSQKYKYNVSSQFCQLIKISSKLLSTILGQYSENFKTIQDVQQKELKKRSQSNESVVRKISIKYQKFINRNQEVPDKFKNQIQLKIDKLQRAKSVNYKNNNPDFTSFSDQKRKILQSRDEGYKNISQLNRRKYGRNYILQKRMQISRNIYSGKSIGSTQQNKQNQKDLKRGVTLYQSVTLKDDYGIMKQRPFLHLMTSKKRKQFSKIKIEKPNFMKKNQIQIDNITLKNVKALSQKFQTKSKSLYNFCTKRHVNQLV